MEITINKESFKVLHIGKLPSGHGHYKIMVSFLDGNNESHEHTITTSNMPMIDAMNSEDDTEMEKAKKDAAESVIYDFLQQK